jgi:DNA-binding XRE family transcriptional regulator
MPKQEPDEEDLKVRKARAQEWLEFRKNNLLTQKKLAEVLGASRRTIQEIEHARVSAYPITLRKFTALKAKYAVEKVA